MRANCAAGFAATVLIYPAKHPGQGKASILCQIIEAIPSEEKEKYNTDGSIYNKQSSEEFKHISPE